MGDLSEHFSSWEFTCHHCGNRGNVSSALLAALERLRIEVGRPLTIVSGYRCPDYNRRVGGARNSQHLYARAADIPGGYATPEQCQRAGFHGVGVRSGRVVHVDVTPGKGYFTFRDG